MAKATTKSTLQAAKPAAEDPRAKFFAELADADIDRAFTLHYSGEAVLDSDDLRDYAKERQRRITAGTWTGLPIGGEKPAERGGDGLTDDERKAKAAAAMEAAALAEKQKAEDEIRAKNAASLKAAMNKGAGVEPAKGADGLTDDERAGTAPEPVVPTERAKPPAGFSAFVNEGKLNFGPGR